MGQATRRSADATRGTRLFLVAAAAIASASLLTALWRAVEDRRFLNTGKAQWIWLTRDVPEPAPMRFRAWKSFSIETAPASAPAFVFGDPEWTLDVNGVRAAQGAQHPGDSIRTLDLAGLLRRGRNSLVLESRSPRGVGGLLFRLVLRSGREVVSDGSWRVVALPLLPSRRIGNAAVWGRPPMYPWGYPPLPRAGG